MQAKITHSGTPMMLNPQEIRVIDTWREAEEARAFAQLQHTPEARSRFASATGRWLDLLRDPAERSRVGRAASRLWFRLFR